MESQPAVVFVSWRVPERRLQDHFAWNDAIYRRDNVRVFPVTDQPYDVPEYAECVIFPEDKLPLHQGQRRFALTRTKNAGIRAAIAAGCDPIVCSDVDISFELEAWQAAMAVTDQTAAVPIYRMSTSSIYFDRETEYETAILAEGTITMTAANWGRVQYCEAQWGYGGDDGTIVSGISKARPLIRVTRAGHVYHMAHVDGSCQKEFQGRTDHWNRTNGLNPDNFRHNARYGTRGTVV